MRRFTCILFLCCLIFGVGPAPFCRADDADDKPANQVGNQASNQVSDMTSQSSGDHSAEMSTEVLAESAEQDDQWIPLFNGKDLRGWTPKFTGHPVGVNLHDTFQVQDNMLVVSYDDWQRFGGQFGHLFYETPFSNYRLRVEYRFVGDQLSGGPGWAWRNNGLMIHGQSVQSMELDQMFPNSIEVQLLGGDGKNERSSLNICTPGSHVEIDGRIIKEHLVQCGGRTNHGDQWVTVEVEVLGDRRIRHIDQHGEVVVQYSKPQLNDGTPMTGGTISIQAESHPTQFRRIDLLPLTSDVPE